MTPNLSLIDPAFVGAVPSITPASYPDGNGTAGNLDVSGAIIKTDQAKFDTNSLWFDGIDDTCDQTTYPTGFPTGQLDFSISYWCYPKTTYPDSMFYFGRENNTTTGKAFIAHWDNGVTGALQLSGYGTTIKDPTDLVATADTWNNIVITQDSGAMKCYLDGSETDSFSVSTANMSIMAGVFSLGCYWGTGTRTGFAETYLQDVCVWDIAISSSLVTEINAPKKISEISTQDNVLSYWDCQSIDSGVLTNIAIP